MIAAGVMMYGTGGRQAPPWLVRIEEDFSAVSEELEEIPESPMEIAAGDTGSGDKSEGAGTAGTAGANENAGNSESVKTGSSIPDGQIYENVRSLELETVSEQVQIVETEDLEEGQVQPVAICRDHQAAVQQEKCRYRQDQHNQQDHDQHL